MSVPFHIKGRVISDSAFLSPTYNGSGSRLFPMGMPYLVATRSQVGSRFRACLWTFSRTRPQTSSAEGLAQSLRLISQGNRSDIQVFVLQHLHGADDFFRTEHINLLFRVSSLRFRVKWPFQLETRNPKLETGFSDLINGPKNIFVLQVNGNAHLLTPLAELLLKKAVV